MGHDLRPLAHTVRLAESCEEPAGDLTGDKEGDESQW